MCAYPFATIRCSCCLRQPYGVDPRGLYTALVTPLCIRIEYRMDRNTAAPRSTHEWRLRLPG